MNGRVWRGAGTARLHIDDGEESAWGVDEEQVEEEVN
ncbi:hypothetical protein Gorai_004477, partial [Gossypium raimondii]|nr:hypothetical protein [Gossypium raimondii]